MIKLLKIHASKVGSSDVQPEVVEFQNYNNCQFSSVGEMINFVHKSTGYLFFEEDFHVHIIEHDRQSHCLIAEDTLFDEFANETLHCYIYFLVE